MVDVFRGDPGAAGGLGAVDSVAGWDGPFCLALFEFLGGAGGQVGQDERAGDGI